MDFKNIVRLLVLALAIFLVARLFPAAFGLSFGVDAVVLSLGLIATVSIINMAHKIFQLQMELGQANQIVARLARQDQEVNIDKIKKKFEEDYKKQFDNKELMFFRKYRSFSLPDFERNIVNSSRGDFADFCSNILVFKSDQLLPVYNFLRELNDAQKNDDFKEFILGLVNKFIEDVDGEVFKCPITMEMIVSDKIITINTPLKLFIFNSEILFESLKKRMINPASNEEISFFDVSSPDWNLRKEHLSFCSTAFEAKDVVNILRFLDEGEMIDKFVGALKKAYKDFPLKEGVRSIDQVLRDENVEHGSNPKTSPAKASQKYPLMTDWSRQTF